MTLKHLNDAIEIIRANPQQADFVGPRHPSLLASVEEATGFTFPPTYRQFLLEFGAGNFGAFEVYGVIDEDWESSSVPDGVWYTMDERKQGTLPDRLFVIGDTGDGGLYCLDFRSEDESGERPVVIFWPGFPEPPTERAADDFGAFFLKGVTRQARKLG